MMEAVLTALMPLAVPTFVAPAVDPAAPVLVSYEAGPVRCGGRALIALRTEAPLPSGRSVRLTNGVAGSSLAPPITLRFRIAADGRPLSIESDGTQNAYAPSADVAPAFATWRFPAGERAQCSVTFRSVVAPIEQARPDVLVRFVALGQPMRLGGRDVGRAAFDRLAGPDARCDVLRQRLLAFPDFDRIAHTAGGTDHTLLRFDVDADGRTGAIRVIGSSGNAELDRQSRDAVERSRWNDEAKAGCLRWFYRTPGEPTAAPPAPDPDALRPADARCPPDADRRWATLPTLRFPEAWRRRSLEGWAVVRFDVAPWGAVGEVRAVTAEPAAEFGEQAVAVLRGATLPPSPVGATGCTTLVRYVLPEDTGDPS